ncbi:MAG: hypothetical protein WBJ10_12065 [Daejeonella sp.]|uniref:hypothetical protein n=1 Tax=Daejeonella sp. TaxID=2805397 RepID=UPI003C767CDC
MTRDKRNHPEYIEVDPEIIKVFREKGYKNLHLGLLPSDGTVRATVEVVPVPEECFGLDLIPINSKEISDYFNEPSPMCRYVMNRRYV